MSTTLQQVPTDTYTVDPVHSSFGFGVKYNRPRDLPQQLRQGRRVSSQTAC